LRAYISLIVLLGGLKNYKKSGLGAVELFNGACANKFPQKFLPAISQSIDVDVRYSKVEVRIFLDVDNNLTVTHYDCFNFYSDLNC